MQNTIINCKSRQYGRLFLSASDNMAQGLSFFRLEQKLRVISQTKQKNINKYRRIKNDFNEME